MTRQRTRRTAFANPFGPNLFDTLPDEILEHIFRFLDHRSLLSSLLVNKRFCEIIEESRRLMENLPFTIIMQRRIVNNESHRRYTSVKFYDSFNSFCFNDYFNNFVKKKLEEIAHQVKIVEYVSEQCQYTCIPYRNNLGKLLTCLPKTEVLTISGKLKKLLTDLPQLPNLKYLKFHKASITGKNQLNSLLSFFLPVKDLSLSFITFERVSPDEIKDETKKLKNLQRLTVEGYRVSYNIVHFGSFENLREFIIVSYNDSINWKKFIENNPKLETIEVNISIYRQWFDTFQDLVSCARSGMELKIYGSFQLTEDRLRHFEENALRGVKLTVEESSIRMSEEVFTEIIGDKRNMINVV